jgi:calreticulin
MIYQTVGLTFLSFLSAIQGKIYFKEDFNDASWSKRWVTSDMGGKPAAEIGEFKQTAGEWFGDASDKGIQTSEDARFYGISAKMDSPFTNKDKELVLQMSVKHEQDLDCGGAYIKLMGPDVDQAKFGGETPYQIMFGPDICGYSNRKTHAIFNYEPKNENLLIKDELKVETDKLTHLYTLVVKPDNTFEVFIDLESVRNGSLEAGWDFLLPKEIPDPAISKPADWVDEKKIADPDDKKPDGYDDIPAEIPDPDAKKPDDWDDEEDGEWESPNIDNPEYKGPWSPKMIDNPAYKGEWEHPVIPNPDYKEDKELYMRCKDCTHVGFELWQVKSGTIFDDIIVTDSFKEAKEYAEKTFAKKKGPEKEMYDAKEAEKKAEADRVAAENAAAADEEEDDEEDDEHDEL